MATASRDENRPRRFDASMSRRTIRRPAAARLVAADCDRDAHQLKPPSEHKTSLQLEGDDGGTACYLQEPQEEGQDNSLNFSLQELMDETINGDDDRDHGAATGSQGEIGVATAGVHGVAESAAGARKQLPGHVVGRRVVRLVRRYVRVKAKHKHATEKKAVPLRMDGWCRDTATDRPAV
ncbi:hypothetical protein CFC21_026856 [Triticum aestivum]|uniref:Uncharacterized protein n=2 Tax=Triticum aestivum TaxID=4565 RepID=A0A9R1EM63_WHEAT|nr:hypothetical protein CFC21_026856 [Triticum aestivum]